LMGIKTWHINPATQDVTNLLNIKSDFLF